MAVKSVRMYRTTDDKVFDTQEKAQAYELASTRIGKLRTILANPKLTQSPTVLAVDIFNLPDVCEQLRDACNAALDYHRRYGKLKK